VRGLTIAAHRFREAFYVSIEKGPLSPGRTMSAKIGAPEMTPQLGFSSFPRTLPKEPGGGRILEEVPHVMILAKA
jgi:hypothetical protein